MRLSQAPEKGRVKCRWLDPRLRLFVVEGENGFRMADDFQEKGPQVQNIKVEVRDE